MEFGENSLPFSVVVFQDLSDNIRVATEKLRGSLRGPESFQPSRKIVVKFARFVLGNQLSENCWPRAGSREEP